MMATFNPGTSSFSSWTLAVLLLLLFCCHDHSSLAHSASAITHLPGFHGPLPFYLETGYVNVDEDNGSELFYYFIESERNPSKDPLLLWLTGGHRCTALSSLLFEIGPLKIVIAPYNGSTPQLVYNQYTWTKVANVIFLDSPVGAGFSYSLHPKGYDVDDYNSSSQVQTFIMKWFKDHPQYLSNPFYIGGDSYAGKLVPYITQKVSEGIEAGQEPLLNLKGYLAGNPKTGEKIDINSRVPYAHGFGIISDQIYEATLEKCDGEDYTHPSNAFCAEMLHTVNELFSQVFMPHILEPTCTSASPKPGNMGGGRQLQEEEYISLRKPPAAPPINCRSYGAYLSYYWANSNATRDALRIKKGTVEEWIRCNEDLPYTRNLASSIKYHRNLTMRGYRALVYSGDHDMVVPFLGTEEWIRSLDYSIVDDWRAWHLNGQAAGFTITYSNNMTFATIKGGGHTAPEFRPKECFSLFERWSANKPL